MSEKPKTIVPKVFVTQGLYPKLLKIIKQWAFYRPYLTSFLNKKEVLYTRRITCYNQDCSDSYIHMWIHDIELELNRISIVEFRAIVNPESTKKYVDIQINFYLL